ncbi:MAG: outer membrane beta-barrel protein [Pseudomonadota bacterium]
MELLLFSSLLHLLVVANSGGSANLQTFESPETVAFDETADKTDSHLLDVAGETLALGDTVKVRLNTGEELRGRIERIQLEAVNSPLTDVSGEYLSELSGGKGKLDGKVGVHRVTLDQQGDRVLGRFGDHGEIEGIIVGRRIEFTWYSSWTIGKGIWDLSGSPSRLEGKWSSNHYDDGGQWNLVRTSSAPKVVPVESEIELLLNDSLTNRRILLSDIDLIAIQKSQINTAAKPAGAVACQPDDAALKAIDRARSAWLASDYPAGSYRLIEDAEAAAAAPECDSIRARILAEKFLEIEVVSEAKPALEVEDWSVGESTVGVTPSIESQPDKNRKSQWHEGTYLEWDFYSNVQFDDGVVSGDYVSITGLNLGYAHRNGFSFGYQGNYSLFFEPQSDREPEPKGDLSLIAHMLYVRRDIRLSDDVVIFGMLGVSRVESKIEVDELSCFLFFCETSSRTLYSNKENGPAWGIGLEKRLDYQTSVSAKYIDYSVDSFDFGGLHIGYKRYWD